MAVSARGPVLVTWSVVLLVGLLAGTARPREEGGEAPKPTRVAEVREALAILKDLRELADSVRNESRTFDPDPALDAALLRQFGRPERPKPRKVTLDAPAIDVLIDQALARAKVVPAHPTGDEEFVRRLCLDITGRMPTPEQVIRFVQSKNKAKRAELIDHLLATPAYARNWARYWRDVVQYHANVNQPKLARFSNLEDWLAGEFERNVPWDEIATRLITAIGRTDENGAAVLTAAQMGQAVELAGEVSRVFLGVQIQCAQCHDHPNDPWKRQQFHEFAAFFAGIRSRPTRRRDPGAPPALEVTVRGKPRYTMPDLKDPKKSIPVRPKFFLASHGATLPDTLDVQQRRVLAASYITGPDNPWFARAFVNRVWAALVGEGFYNPIDDLGPTRKATQPEVLDALANAFRDGGYDVRWLFRTILNTRAYQRQFRPVSTGQGQTPFAANCPSRLRADQILEALDHALGGPRVARAASADEEGKPDPAAPMALLRGPRTQLLNTFGVDPSIPTDDVLGTIPQALFLMNNPQVNRAIQARRGTALAAILQDYSDNREALEALYLRVLARHPSPEEVRTCGQYLEMVGNRSEAFEDILWALVNSTEFVSRR